MMSPKGAAFFFELVPEFRPSTQNGWRGNQEAILPIVFFTNLINSCSNGGCFLGMRKSAGLSCQNPRESYEERDHIRHGRRISIGNIGIDDTSESRREGADSIHNS